MPETNKTLERYRIAACAAVVFAAGMLAGCPPVQPPAATMPAAKVKPGTAPVLGGEPKPGGAYVPLGSYVPLTGDALSRATIARGAILAETRSLPEPSSRPATSTRPSDEAPPMAVKFYLQGREKFMEGANSKAMEYLEKALSLDPDAFSVLKLLGRVSFAAGQLPKGSLYLQRAYSIHPHDVEVNYFLGRYWLESKDPKRAVAHLLQADDSPERSASSAHTPLVSFYLARALQQAGYHLEAAKQYERFLDTIAIPVAGYRYDRELNYLIEESWTANLLAAENYVLVGAHGKALSRYEAALARNGRNPFIASRLVNALVHTDKPLAARKAALELVNTTNGDDDSIKLLVWAYRSTGQEHALLADLRKALPTGEDDPAPTLTLASTQDYLGDKAAAFETLAGYAAKHPRDLRVLERVLNRVHSAEMFEQGLRLAAESLKAVPERHDEIARLFLKTTTFLPRDARPALAGKTVEFAYFYGVACRAEDDLSAAEACFGEALRISPDYFPAREAQVSTMLAQERFREAVAVVQEAVDKSKGGPKAYQLLVQSEAAQQRFVDALRLAKDAVKKYPEEPELRLQLAAIHRARGEDAEARTELAALVKASPKFEPGYRALVNLLMGRSRDRGLSRAERDRAKNESESYIVKLTQVLPNSVFGRMSAAIALANDGRLADAETILRRVAAEHPEDVEVLSLLAQLRQIQGRPQEAVTTLEEPLKKHPTPALAAALASLYRDIEKPAEAISLLEGLAKDRPSDEGYIAAQVQELMAQKKEDEAIKVLAAALPKFPKSEQLVMTLSRLQARTGKPLEGIATMQAFMAKNGETAARFYSLSHLQSAAGQEAEAEASLQRVLSRMPDHTGANNDLGYYWTNAGKNLDRAEQMINKALENEPNNAAFMDSLGWLYYRQGRFDKAVSLLKKSVTLPNGLEPEVVQHLADALYRAGQKMEAGERFRQAQQLLREDGGRALSAERQKVKDYLEATISALREGKEPRLTPTAEEESSAKPLTGQAPTTRGSLLK